jgi:hypothetical protein
MKTVDALAAVATRLECGVADQMLHDAPFFLQRESQGSRR